MPLASELAEYEDEILAYHRSRGELSETNWNGQPVTRFVPRDRDGYFYAATSAKEKIVLHYTIGFLGGDLSTLTRDDFHVSVPFLIARSGLLLQLFDPKYWSYHLTPGAMGGNKRNSRASVAIELSNIGPLERSGNWMWNIYGDRYCRVSERDYFHDLGSAYRGFRYFASFTAAQYQTLGALLPAISGRFGIPARFLPEQTRYDLFASSGDAQGYRGICSHVNFQPPEVKNDIGPAFDWGAIGAHESDPLIG